MKKKAIIFHRAIAPYRIDFFNSLSDSLDAEFYFEFGNALEQSFKQENLTSRLNFTPKYLKERNGLLKNIHFEIFPILNKYKPQIIFCSEFNLMGLLLVLYKLLFNREVKIISICDDNVDIAKKTRGIKKYFRNFLIQQFSHIILVSPDSVRWYEKNVSKVHNKFIFFPIVQEDNYFRHKLEEAYSLSLEYRKEYALNDTINILFVGRLIDIKNLPLLINAFSEIDNPNARLIFVGEGNQEKELKIFCEKNGLLDRIIFAGKQENERLFAWYNIGDIFVLPSYYERFGAVVNEALLAGCFTLCSSVAGASCLIKDGDNGFVFDPQYKEELILCLKNGIISVKGGKKTNKMIKQYKGYYSSIENVFYGK